MKKANSSVYDERTSLYMSLKMLNAAILNTGHAHALDCTYHVMIPQEKGVHNY